MAKYENIENIGKLKEGLLSQLSKRISGAEKSASEILKKLNDMESLARQKKAEEELAKKAAAELEQKAAEQPAVEEQPVKSEPAPAPAPVVAEEKPVKAEEVVEAPAPAVEEQPVKSEPAPAPAPAPVAEEKPAKQEEKKTPSFIVRRIDPSQISGMRPQRSENKTFINRDTRPQKPHNGQQRPAGGQSRPAAGGVARFAPAPAPVAAAKGKNFGPDKKKQSFEKTYIEKDKRTINKRALVKQQGASISDFDENKSGYRKLRVKKDKQKSVQTVKIERAVVTTDDIPIKSLSEKIGVTATVIVNRLFKEGVMTNVNGSIDYDTAALLAADFGVELEYKPEKTAEEVLFEQQADTVEEIEKLVPRAPVVTVMGHVDHGKTSLLDYIRKSKVTAGEAGGITQHIGAYTVKVGDKGITFIDTPGHEAFTAMRARGAQVTDIVILVVAADDGIMPQTVEAISHAKAAGVEIIVAVNKIDKVGANVDKIKQDLMRYEIFPEDYGGKTVVCPISCKTGEGIDNLLDSLILIAEMKDLLANPEKEARGIIIEARLDKGKGPVATVLVQNGTLHTGDNIISGLTMGKVRAMIDDTGKTVKQAGPSMAVNVLGFEEVPNSGDTINAVSQALMKQVLSERKDKISIEKTKSLKNLDFNEAFGELPDSELKYLNLIIKGDVQGSVEAVKQSVLKLSNEEVQIKVIHSAAGAVTETDVMLAESANAMILCFNVRPDAKAKTLAERSKVDVRTYRIIYELLDDIERALKGMRTPKYQDVLLGKCEVRQTFKITGAGNIAGCYVLDGKIVRGGKLRIYREDILIVEGGVRQLKRFKDDVKEVAAGFECGCAIEGFNDIKIGDIIECYQVEEIKQD
ncbi:MAG: translation initiation factor IF-2 [Clostridia bacterium]|nr:translation initiation factor IF-2 [Clostridia bacterium]